MATTIAPSAIPTGRFEVTNPRTGETLYAIDEPTDDVLADVYDRARAAFDRYKKTSVRERLAMLAKVSDYVLKNKEHICDKVCEETGKPRTEALLTEIFPTLDLIKYYKDHAEKILRDEKHPTPLMLMGKQSRVYYEPLGAVLIISPWNYPFNLAMTPIVTALAAGNTVVFKPSEYTPLKGLIEEILEGAGVAKDLVQVVYGAKETGQRLIDRQPAKVFFTGSEAAGKAIMRQCAEYLIPIELELGGKDPMVVFDDVDIKRAANGALWGSMTNAGQTCTSIERVFVHEKVYRQFVDEFSAEARKITTPYTERERLDERGLDMGCMTTGFQLEKVEDQIQDALSKGAKIVCGGKRDDDSQVFPPTILTDVTPSMKIYAEETFGPVATVVPFKTEEEAIRLANDTTFGLSSSVWSADKARAERIARQIVTGNVSINNVLATQGNSALPFGGTKHSGMGRYKGAHGLYSFSNIKSVMFDKNSGRFEPIWYPYTPEKHQLIGKLIDHAFGGGILNLIKTILVGLKLEKLETKRHY